MPSSASEYNNLGKDGIVYIANSIKNKYKLEYLGIYVIKMWELIILRLKEPSFWLTL